MLSNFMIITTLRCIEWRSKASLVAESHPESDLIGPGRVHAGSVVSVGVAQDLALIAAGSVESCKKFKYHLG